MAEPAHPPRAGAAAAPLALPPGEGRPLFSPNGPVLPPGLACCGDALIPRPRDAGDGA